MADVYGIFARVHWSLYLSKINEIFLPAMMDVYMGI